mmetsp:Transcript_11659/g.11584  ORF Transcript_11659/g.11584 Transcript_11659/m.11584 type:complete len:81 (+) Transcript_11659:1078-1320(+)
MMTISPTTAFTAPLEQEDDEDDCNLSEEEEEARMEGVIMSSRQSHKAKKIKFSQRQEEAFRRYMNMVMKEQDLFDLESEF